MNSQIAESRFRVRYAETDQMGVVYYSNYLVWMEIGRGDLCRKCGFAYRELEDKEGISIAVADVQCRYRAPARYDDAILVHTRVKRVRRRVLTFTYEITNETTGQRLAEGYTTHVAVGRNGKPCSLPDRYYQLLSG